MKQNLKLFLRKNVMYVTAAVAFLLSSAVLALCAFNAEFAQWYALEVSAIFRYVLSLVTGFLPFSVVEICLLLLPVWLLFAVIFFVRRIVNKSFSFKRLALGFVFVVCAAFSAFVNVFGVCYFTKPLEAAMGLERSPLSKNELYKDAVYTHDKLSEFADKVTFDETGASVNPHSFFETGRIIDEGYAALNNSGVFRSHMIGMPKPVLLSPLMTYTHISGMYMPFTGEANVNTNYPDYVVAFTIAHEKAHQRGVADEDEANFVAFLACMASKDDYLKYCAMMNMYDYYLDETLQKDLGLYTTLVDLTDRRIVAEMYSYYRFFEKYSNSAVSDAANKVNDTYIKAMGNEEGTQSYGLVIELYHAYLNKEKKA